MTPRERAELTQDQLDRLMEAAGAGEVFTPGGSFHPTTHSLCECEPHFPAELPAESPFLFEGLLMEGLLSGAIGRWPGIPAMTSELADRLDRIHDRAKWQMERHRASKSFGEQDANE